VASIPSSSGIRTSIRTNVGIEPARFADRLLAIRGLADDIHVPFGVKDHAETGADERLVVDDQDADSAGDVLGGRSVLGLSNLVSIRELGRAARLYSFIDTKIGELGRKVGRE
jgi:hypothetical protein